MSLPSRHGNQLGQLGSQSIWRRASRQPVGASAGLVDSDFDTPAAHSGRALQRQVPRGQDRGCLLVFIALLILVAIFAPQIVSLAGEPGPDVRDTGPSTRSSQRRRAHPQQHYFGVDQLGRDVFSRTIYGTRVSIEVAFAATFLATVAGIIAGLLAGYFRGWVDTLISRIVDVLLAIPYLLLATGIAAACTLGQTSGGGGAGCFGGLLKPGLGVVIFVISFTSWTYMARIVRGQTLSLREKEFVEASRSMGATNGLDRLPRAAAEPDRTDHRLRLDPDPPGDPLRGRALVPRPSASRTSRAGAR